MSLSRCSHWVTSESQFFWDAFLLNSFHLSSNSPTISLTALDLILFCLLAYFYYSDHLFFSRFLVQFSSVTQSCLTPWTAAHQASLSIANSQSLLKLMSIESMMSSNHLILCYLLLLLCSVFPSIRVSSNESVLPIRWPKDWSFSFSISPSNEYSGLISFRVD